MKTKRTHKFTTGFYFLFGLLVLNTPVSAKGIYKCVKPNGEVEYTQSASKNCDVQQIKKQGGRADQKAIEELHDDRKRSKIAEGEQRQATLEKQDKERAEKEMEEYCVDLKENLEQITIANRVFETSSEGERVRLSEEQRQQRIQDNQKSLDANCN